MYQRGGKCFGFLKICLYFQLFVNNFSNKLPSLKCILAVPTYFDFTDSRLEMHIFRGIAIQNIQFNYFSHLGKSTEKYITKLKKMNGDKFAAVLVIKNFAEEDLNNDYFLELKPGTPDALE